MEDFSINFTLITKIKTIILELLLVPMLMYALMYKNLIARLIALSDLILDFLRNVCRLNDLFLPRYTRKLCDIYVYFRIGRLVTTRIFLVFQTHTKSQTLMRSFSRLQHVSLVSLIKGKQFVAAQSCRISQIKKIFRFVLSRQSQVEDQ